MADVGVDEVAVSQDYADDHGLALGDPVPVTYPDGAVERPTVGAIYAEEDLSAACCCPRRPSGPTPRSPATSSS